MNAEALSRAGAGAWLPPDRITPSAVADSVRTLLADAFHREMARRLASEIAAMPPPRDVLPALVELGRDARERGVRRAR